jgi:poly(A) polymerase
VLPEIVPERVGNLEALIAAEGEAGIDPDPLRRLAALLPREPQIAEDIAVRLKLSNKARKRVVCAAGSELLSSPQALSYRVGTDCALDRLLLAGKSAEAALISEWKAPRLPIGGGVLISRGLPEGPIVARTLRAIEDEWVEANFPAGERLDRIIGDALARAKQIRT